jgi:phosphate transport system permease protein
MTSFASTTSSLPPSDLGTAVRDTPVLLKERSFAGLLWCTGGLAACMVVGVICVLAIGASPVLRTAGPLAFVTGFEWHPSSGEYSLVAMIAGTFAVSIGALVLAAPVGTMCAVLCRFYLLPAPAGAFRTLLQLLAGIPSVVYGLWGLAVLVPLIADFGGGAGTSLLAGIIVLAIMIVPTIAVIMETALRLQSPALYQGGIALGLARYRVLLFIVLPAAASKLLAAAILGFARALGETMAVLMVTGNAIALPVSLLSSMRTLAANIALEMAYAVDVHRAALFATGLMLMLIVLGVLGAAEFLDRRGETDG